MYDYKIMANFLIDDRKASKLDIFYEQGSEFWLYAVVADV